MTDRLLIYKFLKNFKIKINDHNFVIIDKINHEVLTNSEFCNLFQKVFDIYTTDETILPIDICQEWFTKQTKKYTKKLDEYLNDCDVTLGNRNWEVKKPDGTIVTDDVFNKLFINNFSVSTSFVLAKLFNNIITNKHI
jgi:hypothetical protein